MGGPRRRGRCRVSARTRNLILEREITEHAARGLADPEALIRHAETRAARLCGEYVTDAMLVATDRNRLREVREELADARNHLVWWLEDHAEHPDLPAAMRALGRVVVAYTELAELA
jgi:hypothetical protein